MHSVQEFSKTFSDQTTFRFVFVIFLMKLKPLFIIRVARLTQDVRCILLCFLVQWSNALKLIDQVSCHCQQSWDEDLHQSESGKAIQAATFGKFLRNFQNRYRMILRRIFFIVRKIGGMKKENDFIYFCNNIERKVFLSLFNLLVLHFCSPLVCWTFSILKWIMRANDWPFFICRYHNPEKRPFSHHSICSIPLPQ